MPFPLFFNDGRVGLGRPTPVADLDIVGSVAITGSLTVAGAAVSGITLGAVGSVPNANGASLTAGVLVLQPADGTNPGVLTAGAQTIGGAKTFSGAISASNLSGTNSGDVTLGAVGSSPSANAATLAAQVLTLQPADATHPGVVTTAAQSFGGAKSFGGDVLPVSDEGGNLGSTLKRWAYVFTDGLKDNSTFRVNTGGGTQNQYTDAIGAPGAGSTAHSFTTHASFPTAGGVLLEFCNLTTRKSSISKDGAYGGTYTDTSGTPGSGTASTVSGRSAIAATSSATITITNTLCTATSVVLATLEDNDATCKSLAVVPGSGSFTVTPGATTGAITKFRWVLFNGA